MFVVRSDRSRRSLSRRRSTTEKVTVMLTARPSTASRAPGIFRSAPRNAARADRSDQRCSKAQQMRMRGLIQSGVLIQIVKAIQLIQISRSRWP